MQSAARLTLATLLGVIAVSLIATTSAVVDAAGAESAALGTLLIEGALALFAVAGALLSTRRVGERLGLGPSRLDGASLAILVAGMLALSHALDGLMGWAGLWEQSALADFGPFLEGARGRTAWLFVLAFAFAPAIAEELLCRGLVQRGLDARLGPTAAIATSALVFGAIHLEPIHGGFAALLGLYLGVVTWWSNSLRPAIVCHLVNNLSAVLLAIHSGDTLRSSPASIAPALLLTGACLWGARRRLARTRPAPTAESSSGAAGPEARVGHSADPALQPDAQPDDR